MSTWDIAQQAASLFGGTVGLGVMVRWAYRSLSKTHRRAVDADTTRDLVEIATSMLEPSEKALARLSGLLAEEEQRANRLAERIKELENSATIREREMVSLNSQVQELKSQLLDAQLEVTRLRNLLVVSGFELQGP